MVTIFGPSAVFFLQTVKIIQAGATQHSLQQFIKKNSKRWQICIEITVPAVVMLLNNKPVIEYIHDRKTKTRLMKGQQTKILNLYNKRQYSKVILKRTIKIMEIVCTL